MDLKTIKGYSVRTFSLKKISIDLQILIIKLLYFSNNFKVIIIKEIIIIIDKLAFKILF